MAKAKQTFESTFGSYEVTRVIGEGGSGRVYEVVATDGTTYAVKSLATERMTHEKLKRFRNELAFCHNSSHKTL